MTKENITFLTALEEEQLDLQKPGAAVPDVSFREVMGKVVSRVKKKEDKK